MLTGRYRHFIDLQTQVLGAPDEFGTRSVVWVTVGSVWAQVAPVSLRKMTGAQATVRGGAEMSRDVLEVTMHPYPGLAPLTWRILYNGRLLQVDAVRPTNDDSVYTILATEGNEDT